MQSAELMKLRRGFLTGDHPVSKLLRCSQAELYASTGKSRIAQVSMSADRVDEPKDDLSVAMLEVLSSLWAEFYSCEQNVLDYTGKSTAVFEELQRHYGFISRNGSATCAAKISPATCGALRRLNMSEGWPE